MSAAWDAKLAEYRALKAVSDEFDARHLPDAKRMTNERFRAAMDAVPAWVWDIDQKLGDMASTVEDALMDMPSPHLAAFVTKYLIAHGNGRDAIGWDAMLENEAKQLLATFGEAPTPASQEAAQPAATLSQGEGQ